MMAIILGSWVRFKLFELLDQVYLQSLEKLIFVHLRDVLARVEDHGVEDLQDVRFEGG